MGHQPALREGHAWQSVAGHEARTRCATSPACSGTALSSERASAAIVASDCRHRVHAQAGRSVHRRLLLARVSGTLRGVKVQPRLLDTEDRCERRAGRRDNPHSLGGRMDCASVLEPPSSRGDRYRRRAAPGRGQRSDHELNAGAGLARFCFGNVDRIFRGHGRLPRSRRRQLVNQRVDDWLRLRSGQCRPR